MPETDHVDLRMTPTDRRWTYVLLGGGGLLLLTLGPVVAGWLADVPFVPFSGAFAWVGGFDDPWAWVARPVIGLALGLLAAAVVLADEWWLEVHDDHVVTVHGSDRRRLPRADIVGVHQQGRALHIDGVGGRELFDRKLEAPRATVREAFRVRGYPLENE